MDEFRSEWYSDELTFLHEQSVWQQSLRSQNTVYRFLWLRAFHAPLSVCLNIRNHSATIVFKEGQFHGAGEAGRLLRTRTALVPQAQVDAFLRSVTEADFWNIPSPNSDLGGPDGSEWILEAADHGSYKVLTSYVAPSDSPVRVLALMLLFDLAHVRVPANAIY